MALYECGNQNLNAVNERRFVMANALKNRWKFPILVLFVFFRLKLCGNGLIRRKPLMIMKTRDHSSKKSWVWLLRSPNSLDRTFGSVVQSSFCCCKKRSIFLFSCFLIVWLQITDTTNKSQSTNLNFSIVLDAKNTLCWWFNGCIMFQKTSLWFFRSESRFEGQFSHFLNK